MLVTNPEASNLNFQALEAYSHLPNGLYLAEDVRELDRFAIEECAVGGFELMDKAARFAFHTLLRNWPECHTLIVLCGSGNNAGDGYLMAAMAHKRGMNTSVLYASSPDQLKGDARRAYASCQQLSVPCIEFDTSTFRQLLEHKQCVVVDALLGTGLNAPVTGRYADIIEAANQHSQAIVAVDIPSGLCCNTGQVLGVAIKAQVTATFIGLKLGLFTGYGRDYAGKIFCSELELSDEILLHRKPVVSRLELKTLLQRVTPRSRSTHKGECGHVMILGGDTGFGGAVIMASKAALRMGAGLCSVITRKEHRNAILSQLPEAMVHCLDNRDELADLLHKADVIVIGPGLGQSAWSEKLLFCAFDSGKPLVIDADALNLVASQTRFLNRLTAFEPALKSSCVLTPHPGEAARLLNSSASMIQQDRLTSIKALHEQFACNILLKGNGSLMISADQHISLSPYGNPGMASGGMGDVLSGLIGGLMAQGLKADFALQLAVSLHACAADVASETFGERGLLASDLVPLARRLLNTNELPV